MSAAIICRSRVAPHRNAPNVPSLPVSPAERTAALADAVFTALLALQQQLAHPDAKVVREAAAMILDFEKTRLRHDRPVTGTAGAAAEPAVAGFDPREPLGELDPLPGCGRKPAPTTGVELNRILSAADDELDDPDDEEDEDDRDGADEDEPDEGSVNRVREYLQQQADEQDTGERVTMDRARRAARQALDYTRRTAPPASPVGV